MLPPLASGHLHHGGAGGATTHPPGPWALEAAVRWCLQVLAGRQQQLLLATAGGARAVSRASRQHPAPDSTIRCPSPLPPTTVSCRRGLKECLGSHGAGPPGPGLSNSKRQAGPVPRRQPFWALLARDASGGAILWCPCPHPGVLVHNWTRERASRRASCSAPARAEPCLRRRMGSCYVLLLLLRYLFLGWMLLRVKHEAHTKDCL